LEFQTVLGFDFGVKYIGVAVGQSVTCTASPLCSLRAKLGQPSWKEIQQLIARWKPNGLIVGIPLAVDGSEQDITLAARCFAVELEKRYDLPVYLVDERFTTLAAKSYLYEHGGFRALEKDKIDGVSAKIITESGLAGIARSLEEVDS
jgi:putative Holliday junction resolvase